jgi:predicted GIY-YIG superfamily endonuclease
LLQTNKGFVFSFAIYQSSELNTKKDRIALEHQLIDFTKNYNINIQGTLQHAILSQKRISPDFFKIEFIKGSLAKYGLNFDGSEIPLNQSCVYLFINPKKKKFYVGETQDFFKSKVVKRHKGKCSKYFQDIGVNALDQRSVYTRVVQDFMPKNNHLLFTCFKALGNKNKSERIYEEGAVKRLLIHEYPC